MDIVLFLLLIGFLIYFYSETYFKWSKFTPETITTSYRKDINGLELFLNDIPAILEEYTDTKNKIIYYLLYTEKDNEFIAQGNSAEELVENIKIRYPLKQFAVVKTVLTTR